MAPILSRRERIARQQNKAPVCVPIQPTRQSQCVSIIVTTHVETVVLLVRKTPDTYIDITVDMDEIDLTSSEAKATYEEIKDYAFERFGLKVSSLNIAQVKTKCGIIERENYNKPKSENAKQPQCTKDKEEAIMNALRHFKMI